MPIESVRSYKMPDPLPPEEASEQAAAGEQTPEEKEQALLRRMLVWLQTERDRQSENRLQMAIDHDYYDGEQLSDDEVARLEERGQAPLVYNEVKVGLDWIIGAEKRDRTDWRVLPREESDQASADIKTDLLKFVSDTNQLPFMRSQAFEEAVKCGLSFLEDSLSSDATEDILYSGWESWRNCLHDSYHARIDGKDWRYFFRWRILDLDIAKMAFKGKEAALTRAAAGADQLFYDEQEELWYLGEQLSGKNSRAPFRRTAISQMVSDIFNRRERVKVYECWYREPMERNVLRGGPYNGEMHDEGHVGQQRSIEAGMAEVVPSWVMRMHVCYFTEDAILAQGESPFKHNEFPFTPLYAFRRGRDGMPYGFVRNIRDPQDDLNKRMSKSLFLLSTNQLITEKTAFDSEGEYTLQHAIDNASNPQGVFVLADGEKKFEIRRDYAEEQQQMLHVGMDRQFIQSGSGVTDELLGRKTNAVSGKAIEARQDQGSQTTSGVFDHYRLAKQASGQKQLSNIETFWSMPKIIRLIGEKKAKGMVQLPGVPDEQDQPQPGAQPGQPGAQPGQGVLPPQQSANGLRWVKINQPEVQPDGTVRFLNDITETRADFIVDEQDFRASMRQSMFEQLAKMVGDVAKANPMFAVGMIDLVVDVADFPGKDEFLARLRQLQKMVLNPDKPPEDQELEKLAKQAQVELLKANVDKTQSAADKDQAAVQQVLAAADKLDAEADAIRATLTAEMQAVDLQRVDQAHAHSMAQADLALRARAQQHTEASTANQQALAASAQQDQRTVAAGDQMLAAQAQQDARAAGQEERELKRESMAESNAIAREGLAAKAATAGATPAKPAAPKSAPPAQENADLVSPPTPAPGAGGHPAPESKPAGPDPALAVIAQALAGLVQVAQGQQAQQAKLVQLVESVAQSLEANAEALDQLTDVQGRVAGMAESANRPAPRDDDDREVEISTPRGPVKAVLRRKRKDTEKA